MNYCKFNRSMILVVAAVCCLPFSSVLAAGMTLGPGSTLSLGGGTQDLACGDLVVDGTLNLNTGSLTNVGSVTINGTGVINGDSGVINMSGDWINNSGTFNAGTSQVTIDQACNDDVNVAGDTAFYNLTVQTTDGRQITFAAGSTTTVNGHLLMQGVFPGDLLRIRSSSPGSPAFLVVAGTYLINQVDVQDNHAQVPGEWINWGTASEFDSIDGGGNLRWFRSGTEDGVLTFEVSKAFLPSDPGEVTVHIECNTGLPLSSSFTISEDNPVTFVVSSVNANEVGPNCRIWEDSVTGYDASYDSDPCHPFTGSCTVVNTGDAPGCYYEDVHPGEDRSHNQCAITNTAQDASYTVTKDWDVFGSGGGSVEQSADITIYCNNEIVTAPGASAWGGSDDNWWADYTLVGDGASATVTVDTSDETARCYALEEVPEEGIETVNDCASEHAFAPGETFGCTITNTVFFESIPTLNQLGLAILVLLMAGIGVMGIRRMV